MAKTRTPRPRKAASVISLFTFYLSSKSPSARRKLITHSKSAPARRPKARKKSVHG
jgi:hypothetical protein